MHCIIVDSKVSEYNLQQTNLLLSLKYTHSIYNDYTIYTKIWTSVDTVVILYYYICNVKNVDLLLYFIN